MTAPIRFASLRLAAGATVNKLVPVGTFHRDDFPGGKITVDRKYLETMVANWKALGSPELPIDYFHRGDSENDGLPTDAKLAAGWISSLEVRDDGLYAATRWTPKAKAHIEAEELSCFSPTWHPNYPDPKSGKRMGPTLLGGGLLNDPFFKDLPRLAANDAPNLKGSDMDKKMICAALGMDPSCTDEEVMAKLKEVCHSAAKASDTAAALKATADTKDAALKATEAERVKLAEQVAALAAKDAERDTEALVAKLRGEHRITATEADDIKALVKRTDLKFAAELYGKRAPVVPVGEVGIEGKEAEPVDTAKLNAEFDKALDEKLKAGGKVLTARAELKKDPKFAPLFNLKAISAPEASN